MKAVAGLQIVRNHETHEAFIIHPDGVVEMIPSVTTALNIVTGPMFAKVPADRLEAARQRGTDVHAALTDYERDGLISGGFEPFVDAWEGFKRSRGYGTAALSAFWAIDVVNRYHGELDFAFKVKVGGREFFDVVDIKTGTSARPWLTGIQTAAYANLLESDQDRKAMVPVRLRFQVKLLGNGRFIADEFPRATFKAHFGDFRALLRAWNIRKAIAGIAG